MDKRKFEKLENEFYIAFLAIIIIIVLFKEQIYNEIVDHILSVIFLFLFGLIHLKKFRIYRNEKFAKKNRWLWKLFRLSSLIIILQSLLVLFEVLPIKSIIWVATICLFGDIVIDILIDKPQKNETSDWVSFSSINYFYNILSKFNLNHI